MTCGLQVFIFRCLDVCQRDPLSNLQRFHSCLPPEAHIHPVSTLLKTGEYFFFIPTITLEYYLLLFILPLPFLLSLAPSPCSVFNHLLFPLYHIIFSHPSFPSLPLTPLGKSFSHPLPVSHLSSPQPPLPLPSSPPYSYLSMNPQLCLN